MAKYEMPRGSIQFFKKKKTENIYSRYSIILLGKKKLKKI